MSRVRVAVVYSSASRYSLRLIGLISTIVVARLLTPDEIGTYAIAAAIVMILSEFRLLGAGTYLVRELELNESKIRSALGVTILMSWSLGVAVLLSGGLISEWFNLQPAQPIFTILSISFLLAPFVSVPTALMTREYNFGALLVVRLAAAIASLATTVLLILMGFSYFSLAWGYTASILVEVVLVSALRPAWCPWVPSFRGLGSVALFGIYNSLAGMLKRATLAVPDLVIGKMGTTTQVGIFSRGLGFVDFLAQSLMMGVGPVALPYLSDTRRSGGDVGDAYIRAGVMIGGVLWPVLVVASIASLPTIRFFFGDQWDAAAPIASWLAISVMARSVHGFSHAVFVASGLERLMLIKEGIVFAFFLAALILAYPFGLLWAARAFVLGGVVDLVVTSVVLNRAIGLSLTGLIRAWLPNAVLAALCGLATYGLTLVVSFDGDQVWKPIGAMATSLPFIWLIGVFALNHPLQSELGHLLQMATRTYSKFIR